MSNMKDSWKNTGVGLGHAFKDLGKTLINTGKKGVDHAVEWAGNEPAGQPQEQGAPKPAQNAQPIQSVQPVQTAQSAQPQAFDPSVLIADEIRKLAELKEQGILTEEEFNAKKQQLLNL